MNRATQPPYDGAMRKCSFSYFLDLKWETITIENLLIVLWGHFNFYYGMQVTNDINLKRCRNNKNLTSLGPSQFLM